MLQKKRLALLRTNCEKIREIMEKYISSGSSSRRNSGNSQTAHSNQTNNQVTKHENGQIKTQNKVQRIRVRQENENTAKVQTAKAQPKSMDMGVNTTNTE